MNVKCLMSFLIDGLLSNQIAFIALVRGRKKFNKNFRIDCRQFIFSSPPLPSSSCSRIMGQQWCVIMEHMERVLVLCHVSTFVLRLLFIYVWSLHCAFLSLSCANYLQYNSTLTLSPFLPNCLLTPSTALAELLAFL